ncbi:uncharacterized protein LOC116220611 [Clupea harengus]|uniref:Uncharacterized protein LOC116220611 n=1 Tax=Clupea harengus TaxID=7950 RepID=A0A6P8FLG0_CLUHA|nr:uncharacterized protein LOC116220611 [Clupea harengus]
MQGLVLIVPLIPLLLFQCLCWVSEEASLLLIHLTFTLFGISEFIPAFCLLTDNLQKPTVSVHHDRTNKLLDIVCEIPKQSWNVTGCQFYSGHGENFYPTAKIASGNCHFFSVDEDDLFRRLQSVRSREVSCDYTVNTEPSSLSPRSDPYTFTGFLATVNQPLTKNTPLTSPEAGLRPQSTPVELKVATRGDAHTATVSPGSTLHLTSEYTMDASVSPGSTLHLHSEYTMDASGK